MLEMMIQIDRLQIGVCLQSIQQVVGLREESPTDWCLPTTAVQEFGRALSWSQRASEMDLALASVHACRE